MTKEDFFTAIRERPTDYELYLVFSDWLEEHEELELATEFRRCAKHQIPYVFAFVALKLRLEIRYPNELLRDNMFDWSWVRLPNNPEVFLHDREPMAPGSRSERDVEVSGT